MTPYSPWVILSDFGSAFAMGAVGGTIWHGIKGARNSPRVSKYIYAHFSPFLCLTFVKGDRLVGALSVIKARAPVTGGNFGVWGGMFSTFDCAVKGWRQKEDMWNAIISGFLTGGCLAARSESSTPHLMPFLSVGLLYLDWCLGFVRTNFTDISCIGGPRSALGSAIACGILLSVFEGVGVLISRVFNDNTRPQLPPRAFSGHYLMVIDAYDLSQYLKIFNHIRRHEPVPLFHPSSWILDVLILLFCCRCLLATHSFYAILLYCISGF
jgi:mitochondrial import inner membrane translocase subunit TIM17